MSKNNIKTIKCIYYDTVNDDSCPYYKKNGYCNFAHGDKELKNRCNKNKKNLTVNSKLANNTVLEVVNTKSSEAVITPMNFD